MKLEKINKKLDPKAGGTYRFSSDALSKTRSYNRFGTTIADTPKGICYEYVWIGFQQAPEQPIFQYSERVVDIETQQHIDEIHTVDNLPEIIGWIKHRFGDIELCPKVSREIENWGKIQKQRRSSRRKSLLQRGRRKNRVNW